MSRVRELEGGEEIKFFQALPLSRCGDKRGLRISVFKAGWILRREDGGTSKPIVTAKGRLRDGLDTSSTTLGLLKQNRDISAGFLNMRPGLPLMPSPRPLLKNDREGRAQTQTLT